MKNSFRKKLYIIVLCLVIFSVVEIPTGFFKTKIQLISAPENSVVITLKAFPDGYSVICPDGSFSILFEVSVYDTNQNPIPFTLIMVETNNFYAKIEPSHPITGKDGKATVRVYPESVKDKIKSIDGNALLTPASITFYSKKSTKVTWMTKMTYPPVLLVHGFQDTSESMVPLKQYLEEKGLNAYTMDYSTETDMATMSEALNNAINGLKAELVKNGLYTQRVDIVAHSLGGLVARYYTTQQFFIKKQNVRKLIFINVPHHGTPWAEAGSELLSAPYLKELYPTSSLYTFTFPKSINLGLNHNLQVANIALINDEVVPLPSSSLNSWGIKTKIYRIGSEPLNLHSVIENQMGGGARHRQILFYIPVFEEILFYLTNDLTYPQKRE